MTVLAGFIVCAALLIAAGASLAQPANPIEVGRFSGKKLGTIFNIDDNSILLGLAGKDTTVADYRRVVDAMLDLKMGVLAQCVGFPDPVMYPTKVATVSTKYRGADVDVEADKALHTAGTDILTITIEECRKRGVTVVASYRMNSEDFHDAHRNLSDFARAHQDWLIPGTPVMDPAIPGVFEHRMKIFTEVVRDFDVDGIEFDFRRWYHMVSDPLKNYVVLTRMVRETRKMLDEVAKAKGRKRLILGVRVGASLDSEPDPFIFPGMYYTDKPVEASCKDLGLDVKTWIKEGLVDYVCPSIFIGSLPGMPLTHEFADLARGTKTGIYPTLFPKTAWQHGVSERVVTLSDADRKALALYKHDICSTALAMYADGADGISMFNWVSFMRDAKCPNVFPDVSTGGEGGEAVQTYLCPLLGSPKAIRNYMRQPWAVPPKK